MLLQKFSQQLMLNTLIDRLLMLISQRIASLKSSLQEQPIRKNALNQTDIENYLGALSEKGTVNLLAPSVIGIVFNKIVGGTFIGLGLDLFLRMIGVDFKKIIEEMCGEIKTITQDGKKEVSHEDIERAVSRVVDPAFKSINNVHLPLSTGSDQETRIVKLARAHLYTELCKQADIASGAGTGAGTVAGTVAETIGKGASATAGFLTTVFSFIFKSVLRVGGMQLAADTFANPLNRFFGTNIFHSTFNARPPSRQTKFKKNPNFSNIDMGDRWTEEVPKDFNAIKHMIMSWANEVYLNVDPVALEHSSKLDELVRDIIVDNRYITGNFIYISDFKSKKEVVDSFIDEVASISKQ